MYNEPKTTVLPASEAKEFVVSLKMKEKEGWTYKVKINPYTGLALIAAYNPNGEFAGNL